MLEVQTNLVMNPCPRIMKYVLGLSNNKVLICNLENYMEMQFFVIQFDLFWVVLKNLFINYVCLNSNRELLYR